MPATTTNIRMDSEVKAQAQALFSQFGLDMSTAVNIFLREAIRTRGIPFRLQLPPKPYSLEEITDAELDTKLAAGLASMQEGRGRPASEVFDRLEREFNFANL